MNGHPRSVGHPTFDRFAGRRPPRRVQVEWCPVCDHVWPEAPADHGRACGGKVMALTYSLDLDADW